MFTRRILLGLCIASTLIFNAFAQEFPTKPIRLVVPFPADGTAEMMATVEGDTLRWLRLAQELNIKPAE